MDMNKMLEEMIKQQAEKVINEKISEYVDDMNINDYIDERVEQKLDNKICSSDKSLEDYIIKATKSEMFQWFENNIGRDEIKECIREAFVDKLKNFSMDELVEIFTKIK